MNNHDHHQQKSNPNPHLLVPHRTLLPIPMLTTSTSRSYTDRRTSTLDFIDPESHQSDSKSKGKGTAARTQPVQTFDSSRVESAFLNEAVLARRWRDVGDVAKARGGGAKTDDGK